MFKIFKILLGLIIGFFVVVLIINKIDSEPSQKLKHYQKLQKNHKVTNKKFSLPTLMERIAQPEEIKRVRLDFNSLSLSCFAESTCSNSDYELALVAVPKFLNDHKETLFNFNKELRKDIAVTISPEATAEENLFISLDFLIRLQLTEINYLYSKTNADKTQSEKATLKALLLDKFITKSLKLPNLNFTAFILSSKLMWLRSSLQKYSPSKVDLSEISADKIIESAKLGEFILFSNLILNLIQNSSTDRLEKLTNFRFPMVSLSKNRTLNLYVDLLDKYSKADCVKNEDQNYCTEINFPHIHPINPAGKSLVKIVMTSPLIYQKITSKVKKINALNL
jgi:hypothetical protein